jgi:hypothetical protein
MKSISISKTLNFTKGSIEVRYKGIPSANTDLNKIDALLEDFINNHKHNYMIENVSIVRTILKDCEEKLLVIFYQDEKGSELVKYDNSNLFLYEKIQRKGNSEHFDRYKIKYELPYGIKLDYNNHETDMTDYSGTELVPKKITEIMKQIYYLKNAKAVVLDTDAKALIEIYKLFYNENPDFSSKDINIKIQTMMSILAEFGISLGDDYGFSLLGKVKMPVSLNLEQRVNKLYPLGEVRNLEDSVKLAEETKKIIRIVGETIKETISNEQNQNEALITISKVIHAGRYCLSSNSDVKILSEFTERTTDEVESSIKLVKRIETRIDKQVK